jgi:hypothetical protein
VVGVLNYCVLFNIYPTVTFPGYVQAAATVIQTCVENMVGDTFFHQMNSMIALFLDK